MWASIWGKEVGIRGSVLRRESVILQGENDRQARFYLKSREVHQDGDDGGFQPVNSILLSGLLEKLGSGVTLLEMGCTRARATITTSQYQRRQGCEGARRPARRFTALAAPVDKVQRCFLCTPNLERVRFQFTNPLSDVPPRSR